MTIEKVRKKTVYPKNRKSRVWYPNPLRGKVSAPKRLKLQEMQLKLAGYCPPFSAIYTISYFMTRCRKHQYTDVYCINNNKLFKITRIVAHVLGYRISRSKSLYAGMGAMLVKTIINDNTENYKNIMIENEIRVIKDLAKKMYNNSDAYQVQSMMEMNSEYTLSIEEIPNHTKKSYIVGR